MPNWPQGIPWPSVLNSTSLTSADHVQCSSLSSHLLRPGIPPLIDVSPNMIICFDQSLLCSCPFLCSNHLELCQRPPTLVADFLFAVLMMMLLSLMIMLVIMQISYLSITVTPLTEWANNNSLKCKKKFWANIQCFASNSHTLGFKVLMMMIPPPTHPCGWFCIGWKQPPTAVSRSPIRFQALLWGGTATPCDQNMYRGNPQNALQYSVKHIEKY